MVEQWQPNIIDYQQEISQTESWGSRARKLWGDKLGRFAESASNSSALIFTQIGMAVSGIEEPGSPLIVHKDGSHIPNMDRLIELNHLLTIPKVIFLVASTVDGEHINAVSETAREFREIGAECVIAILSSVAAERQDRKNFDDKITGKTTNQVATLKGSITSLSRYCDGTMTVQDHSDRVTELFFREGTPNLSLDAMPLLLTESGYQNLSNLLILGPDFGRADEARVAANRFGCFLLSLEKNRDRYNGGRPTMIWPLGSREWIRDSGCTVACFDDEWRDCGTSGAIAADLEGFTKDLRFVAVKAIMSDEIKPRTIIRDGRMVLVKPKNDWIASSSVSKINKPWVTDILTTDAVQPQADLSPIADRLRIVSLRPHLEALIGYLKQNWIPSGENWMRNPVEMGTFLSLNLAVEKHK